MFLAIQHFRQWIDTVIKGISKCVIVFRSFSGIKRTQKSTIESTGTPVLGFDDVERYCRLSTPSLSIRKEVF